MALLQPDRDWWKPLAKAERLWVRVSVAFVIVLFFSLPLWHLLAQQNTPHESYRVSPSQFQRLTNSFIEQHKVGSEKGIPIVSPPEGDVYLMALQYLWIPVLQLQKGKTYRLHISSLDVNHGFSLQPINMNFQIVPGYDYVITLTPTLAGEYSIVCNEFCGLGHHLMSGKITVRE